MEFLLTLRRRGISDAAVLRAMDEVPREHFVAAEVRRRGLRRPGAADRLRADHQPALCRRLHDRAAGGRSRITACSKIGTGSGYQAAMLSRIARSVVIGRALPHAGRDGARALRDARLHQRRRSILGDGLDGAAASMRRSTASSSRRRPRACPQALVGAACR